MDTTGRKGYENVDSFSCLDVAAVYTTVPLFTTNTEYLHVLITVLFIQFNSHKRQIQREIIVFFTAKVDFRWENNFVSGKI